MSRSCTVISRLVSLLRGIRDGKRRPSISSKTVLMDVQAALGLGRYTTFEDGATIAEWLSNTRSLASTLSIQRAMLFAHFFSKEFEAGRESGRLGSSTSPRNSGLNDVDTRCAMTTVVTVP